MRFAGIAFDREAVGENFLRAREPQLEKAVLGQARHFRALFRFDVDEFRALRVAQVGADDDAGLPVDLGAVHAEKIVRARLDDAGERLQFSFGDNHKRRNESDEGLGLGYDDE